MDKKIVTEPVEIDTTGGISINEFLSKYKEITSEALSRYDQVSNFEITGASYGDDESFYQSIIISFDRLETDSEFEARKYKSERAKEDEINSLKKLIDNNKEEAVKYIKELNLI